MDIDLVYLWVDGNDPNWLAKKNAFIGNVVENTAENCKGRYADNEELKYSLRSVEKYAPWVRKIFIVTDNQTPNWLDTTNPKVEVIDHKDILPAEALPCFNATVIEHHLYKIPGLSEHFLYANDDMFFSADVQPNFFFADDGFPIIYLKKNRFGKLLYYGKFLTGKTPGYYRTIVHRSQMLVKKKFGKYYSGLPHHNIDAYRKSDFQDVIETVFSKEVESVLTCHMRSKQEKLQRSGVSYYALAIGHGHLRYVENSESLRIPAHKADFMKDLLHFQPKLFCLNDCLNTTDDDRARIKPFLEKLFPEKSAFEI